MKVKYTGRHVVISSALKGYIQEKLDRLSRYGVRIESAVVLLEVQKFRHIAEAQILVNGKMVQGKTSTREMYQSIDVLVEKLERQIKKQKEIFKSKRTLQAVPPRPAKSLKKKKKEVTLPTIRPMLQHLTILEAVDQIKWNKSSFLVFMNVVVHRIQIVHQLESGHLQLIDPKVGVEAKV